MKHQQILDKLAARFLVQALDESFARAMTWGITAKEFSLDLQNQIWQKILSRWDCVLQEEDKKEVSAAYKQKTILAMAVIAHKYGLNIDSILPQALAAIDALNAAVELSDDFERRSPQIKAFLQTPPQPLKRRPAMPDNITFLRCLCPPRHRHQRMPRHRVLRRRVRPCAEPGRNTETACPRCTLSRWQSPDFPLCRGANEIPARPCKSGQTDCGGRCPTTLRQASGSIGRFI